MATHNSRALENANDDTSYLRVVNFPARGIGARTLEQLQDAARASGRSLAQSVAAVPGVQARFDALVRDVEHNGGLDMTPLGTGRRARRQTAPLSPW